MFEIGVALLGGISLVVLPFVFVVEVMQDAIERLRHK